MERELFQTGEFVSKLHCNFNLVQQNVELLLPVNGNKNKAWHKIGVMTVIKNEKFVEKKVVLHIRHTSQKNKSTKNFTPERYHCHYTIRN